MIDMGIAILLAAVFIMVTMAMTAADFELNLLSTAWTASATSNIEVRPCTPRPNGMDTYTYKSAESLCSHLSTTLDPIYNPILK